MDTVSMLNKMSFYCQPILPLVYDESMSYYETLCKVVGQLNTTGETVNKLNEGLTGEIADRQAADAALDARIKEIEKVNKKIHFLKVDTLGHLLTENVTREKLSQWVQDGDIIAMLYAPDEQENSWAVATNYRCLGATGADSMQLSFYVPISVTNNAGKSGMDVAQEVVVISLPVGALTNQWTVRSITSTIPNTNADGFVNLTATVGDAGAVTCDVEPGAIVEALRNYFSGTNQYAVAVNARLTYDGKQYHSASAIVKADASGSGKIRIEFENYYNGVRAVNGVSQMNTETIFLVGDVSTNAWSVETIDHKTFDFSRYEGFQFTRGADNVITANDESTPNAVYAQYHSDTSGKLYQNLPTRLIDTVDGAEYWNGVFDIKDGNHMTFTFVASNYATASDKMLVRVIELSANVNTTAWKYAEKEFELPITGSFTVDDALSDTSTNPVQNKVITGALAGKASTAVASRTANGLMSSSDYIKLLGIEDGATNTVVDAELNATSTNPVQNKAVKTALDGKASTEVASQTANGLMSKEDKKKLDGVAEGANKTTVIDTLDPLSHNPVSSAALFEALSHKANNTEATEQAAGLMSAKDKKKLNGIEDGANKTIVDEMLSDGSTNPVQNKAITAALASVAREFMYPIAVTATSAEWVVNNGIAYKEASSDRTFNDIKAAYYSNNKIPVCVFERMTYNMVSSSSTAFIFASYRGAAGNDSQYVGLGKYPTSLITINTTAVVISRTAGDLPAVDGTDNGKMLIVNGGEWAMQSVPGATVDAELSTTSENPVQNKTVTAALNSKLPKTGGTVTGALRTNDSFSARGTIAFGEAPIGLSQTADGAAEIRYGNVDVNDNPPPLSRLKVARPTADDDAATKAYVDGKAVAPIITSPVMIRKEGATDSAGVYLSTVATGEKSAEIMLEDVNENAPVAIANLRTPTGAGADNYAATKGYVDSKVASSGSPDAVLYTAQTLTDAQKKQARENVDAAAADFVVNGTINSNMEVTLDKTFAQIQAAVNAGKSAIVKIAGVKDKFIYMPLYYIDTKKILFGNVASTTSEIEICRLTVNNQNICAYRIDSAVSLNPDGSMPPTYMESNPIDDMEIATKKYVDDNLGGAPITIKLGTGNAATSTATFAEIKAALEAGKAPILDSAPGTSHWFALNWTLSGSGSLSIQYGTFNVEGGGMANFTLYNVSVSSTGITYSSSQFTTE